MPELVKPRNARTMAQVGSYKTTVKSCQPDTTRGPDWYIIKADCQGFEARGSFRETHDVGEPIMARVEHKEYLLNHVEAIITKIVPLKLLPEDPVLHGQTHDQKKPSGDH